MSSIRRLARGTVRTGGDVLLWACAVGGVLCTVLAVLGVFAGFGVILFRTGSMAPAIPAGSAALVREIPASEIRVGDVVTVDRAGLLPVTHRVVRVASADTGLPEARTLTLRGDANAADDPAPYTVTSVRRVVAAVPGIARAVATLGDPRVLGPIAIAVSALITGLLWPRRGERRDPGAAPTAPTVPTAQAAPTTPVEPATAARRHAVARSTGGLAVAAVLLGLGGIVGTPTSAVAAPVPTTAGTDDPRLVVDSTLGTGSRLLAPGEVADWLLTISTEGLEHGRVQRELLLTGADGLPVTVQVAVCGSYVGRTDCADPVAVGGPVRPGTVEQVVALPEQDALTVERVRVQVALDADATAAVAGLRSSLAFTAYGEGVAVIVQPPADDDQGAGDGTTGGATADGASGTLPDEGDASTAPPASAALATTGARLWPLLLVGSALLTVGIANVVARGRREEDDR